MSEQASQPEQSVNNVAEMSNEELQAIVNGAGSVHSEIKNAKAYGDLRTAVRESLEAAGRKDAFKLIYNMNNVELGSMVDKAQAELTGRTETETIGEASTSRKEELEHIIDAYDRGETFAERREAIREVLEKDGDEAAFRTVFDKDSLELTKFVNDAREELKTVSTEGLEPDLPEEDKPAEDTLTTVSTEGLDADLPEGDQTAEAEDDAVETVIQGRRKSWFKRAAAALHKGYLRTAYHAGQATAYVGAKARNGEMRRPDESDEAYEQRMQKRGRIAAVGIVAVGAALAYLRFHNGGSGSSNYHESTAPVVDSDMTQHGGPVPSETVVATVSPEYTNAAHTITPGEGWYETFQDMKIPEHKWPELLKEISAHVDKTGVGYSDNSPTIGGDGILLNDGHLSTTTLNYIHDTAQKIK